MAHLRETHPWNTNCLEVTPEILFFDRRHFLRALGAAGIGAIAGSAGCAGQERTPQKEPAPKTPTSDMYPAARNSKYVLKQAVTREVDAAHYNNFYEFTIEKDRVWRMTNAFKIRPWTVEVSGEVHKPGRYDIDALVRKMPLEDRLYRHRCVETWAMAVPWTGFPFTALANLVQPKASARFVRFDSFNRPKQAPGQRNASYPWPYTEGLTIAEAMNELTLLATGIYGHELPKQHGAPLRLVVPWKYGFKGIKSIERIEFTASQPRTFWNSLSPREYSFTANVEPQVPHPRWSQEYEWLIPNRSASRRKTMLYNGYGEYVAQLYKPASG